MSMPEPSPRGRWTGSAIALVVIGLLILIPSGLCTATMGGLFLFSKFSADSANADLSDLLSVLIVGGPFILVGLFLLRAGLRARKPK